ncbi:MAG: Ig-like domain-containing protein [Roseburia sp.]|nr:Ig-like domain-containing protein [Roseburia sp.]
MRKKILLKRMAAMGMAAALAISSFCLPESQVTVYAGSVAADSETVLEETPETETSSEQKSDETTEATETTATKEEVGENTAEQTEILSMPDAATAPEEENAPETASDPNVTGDMEQANENEIEQAKDTDDTALTEETEELAASETAFYTGTTAKSSTSLNLTTEDWDNKAEIKYDESISDITVPENFTMTATISLDQTSYDSLSGSGYLKIQGVVKLGDGWDWNDSQDIKELKSSDFTKSDDNYQTDISIAFTDITPASLRGIYFEIVGQGFNGTVSVSNVKLLKGEDAAPLPQQGPCTIDDFENATVGTSAGWTKEDGYKYSGDVTTSVATLNGSKQLEVGLDYSKDSAEGWSEAKIKKNIAEGIDVSAYNLLTFDITYPSQFDGFKAKGFANNSTSGTEIINKDTSVEGTDIGGNMKKATVSIKFQPNKEKLTDLTLGIVGVNTSFQGNVYIDNIVLSQYDSSADFVDITSTPGAGTQADTSQMPGDVVLADTDATATAKSLYSYLKGLDAAGQVLFGHQNDTHKCVGKNDGVYSDTKDMTGSISGIVGIDSLALTGAELGMTDVSTAVAKSVEISEKAASEGAIITLSTHMPNMSNAKIRATPDGKYKYDFSGCDFTESKDLSNNCAKEVLPGGKYNAQFTTFMDIIADYALALQAKSIPVLFRPYHENSGGWFWWGAASTDIETYNALFRYTEDYLSSRGVHNFIYVYSPNGPITSEEEYGKRYPGDDYVDIVAFDYYNDYNSYPAEYSASFMSSFRTTCQIVKSFGDKRGKVAAIAETGVRVMKADGSDIEGILVKDNPIKGHNWYSQVNQIAKETGMPYYLVWANFGDTNFYVPYKNGEKGQELINEFIDFYNESSSIFANGTNFYGNAADKAVTNRNPRNPGGYFTNVFPKDVIKEGKVLSANVRNASQVQFVLQNGDKTETLNAQGNGTSYEAAVTKKVLDNLGLTDVGTISLVADGKTLAVLTFISFGKEKDTLPANMIDNFEMYYGDNDYLSGTYTENSAAACSSAFELDSTNKSGGSYGGAFHYQLKTNGPEVWTGRMKGLEPNDYSANNCLTMWVKPDGKGQKLVIQLVSNGEDFEVHLTDFVKTTDARYITIPFSELKGKQNGTFDPKSVTTFAVWCNSIAPEGQKSVDIDSSIVFDDIQFANVDLSKLTIVNGYAVTEQPVVQPEEKTKITLPKKAAVKKGKSLQLKAAITPADAKKAGVTWTSSDKKIATVNSKGKVTGKKYGRVTITATAKDGSGVKATCKLTVGYGITYKLNKGKNNSDNPAAYYNEKVTLKNPSRKGYAFKGWYTDKKFKKKITTIKKGAKKNYTLYAKWEKIKVKKTELTSVKNNKSKQIALKYKKVSGAKGYEISYSTDKKFKKSVTKKTTSKTSYTIKNLTKGKTYYVRVRAYKKDSAGKKVYSGFTNVKKIKVKK